MPQQADVEKVLAFGRDLMAEPAPAAHLPVHCHAGISRSTASMMLILAQARPDLAAKEIVAHVVRIRPRAWPNLRMLEMGDALLRRNGQMVAGRARPLSRGRPAAAGVEAVHPRSGPRPRDFELKPDFVTAASGDSPPAFRTNSETRPSPSPVFRLVNTNGSLAAHPARRGPSRRGPPRQRGQVGLVDDQQVALADARPALARDLVAARRRRSHRCESASSGLKVAARLSPPDSMRQIKVGGPLAQFGRPPPG